MNAENKQSRKGVKTKIFGVILIFLGTLNMMLSWRGGFAVDNLYVFFLGGGIFLYAIGAIRQNSGKPENKP
ncbi:MAG: hypothetical protein GY862_16405 [Gammaproteobacteria bacterium]|nr:hypothetical protein [Gammaproteobacteria bacterium]